MKDGSDWKDPENEAPLGQGCWLCHLRHPVVVLDQTALCEECLARWFPGRSLQWVRTWQRDQEDLREQWLKNETVRIEVNTDSLRDWIHDGDHDETS